MQTFTDELLTWFYQHGRHDLPWQKNKTGYRVWVSEIMLQQTQVKTVIPYYARFMRRFPSLKQLANAPLDDVLAHWAGLGYYARARNLQRCAQTIQADYGGRFPKEPDILSQLPGIGDSTAAAIASFAFNRHAAILDGNVKRVLTRFYAIPGDPNKQALKTELWDLAWKNTSADHCADYNQAIMDLGATCCTRTKPACGRCPLRKHCQAHKSGTPTAYPDKSQAIKRKTETLNWVVIQSENKLALLQRPHTGIWGGLWCFPNESDLTDSLKKACSEYHPLEPFTHDLSHRHYIIQAQLLQIKSTRLPSNWTWHTQEEALLLGIPRPVEKILRKLPIREAIL